MAALTSKWGRGAAAGRISREGSLCLDRLLRFAALTKWPQCFLPCDFEVPAIRVYVTGIRVPNWRYSMVSFEESAKAEGLYGFFSILLRQMIKFSEKTLLRDLAGPTIAY